MNVCLVKETGKKDKRNAPLIHAGIDPPVRNPTQLFVNKLQLKSAQINMVRELLPYICMLPVSVITKDMYCASTRDDIDNMLSSKSLSKKSYLVSSIVIPQPRKVLFEDLLIESILAHVYDLQWLSMLGTC